MSVLRPKMAPGWAWLLALLGAATCSGAASRGPSETLCPPPTGQGICEIEPSQAEEISRKKLDHVPPHQRVLLLTCAAEFFSRSCRDVDAEKMLLQAVEVSDQAGLTDDLADALSELGELYDRQSRVAELLVLWDRIEMLPTHSGLRGRLADNLLNRATELFKKGEYRACLDLILRVERFNNGARFNDQIIDELMDPDWVPDLYKNLGEVDRAERIHLARIKVARGMDEPLYLADRLDDYAYFLRSQGKLDESAALRAEATQIRVEEIRQLFSGERPQAK